MTIEGDKKRIAAAAHAIQAGVKIQHQQQGEQIAGTSGTELRIGVNMAMVEHAALVTLLIEKGVISTAEYLRSLGDATAREQARLERELSEHTGSDIHLH